MKFKSLEEIQSHPVWIKLQSKGTDKKQLDKQFLLLSEKEKIIDKIIESYNKLEYIKHMGINYLIKIFINANYIEKREIITLFLLEFLISPPKSDCSYIFFIISGGARLPDFNKLCRFK